ncbi:AAA family ATPase [Helicobacter pylori]|uniref:Chaperone protein ClpB n=1 Tax=Helicobacter pylori TaxID=210 RepID=A0ABD6QUS6_HELPX|nr:ATP-dependent Clp protease ATP-binding subunit [Helicobacter pylori]OOQ14420.1 AAA family ATPase [Helicobacter pylori]PDX03017.1 AAA family ATPase [Helicobacter pylori]WQU60974.1 ATP-dependent Clp protease ATP-binding subunit [Helicobacter pylori]
MDKFNKDLNEVLSHALDLALDFNHVLCTTEHVLLAILEHGIGIRIFNTLEEDNYHKMEQILKDYLQQYIPLKNDPAKIPDRSPVLARVFKKMYASYLDSVGVEELLIFILEYDDCYASKLLDSFGITRSYFKSALLDFDNPNDINDNDINNEEAPKSTPLKKYTKNLSALAQNNALDPVIGREEEILRVIEILGRRKKNNPLLIGEAGVGKTSIAEALALKIAQKEVPEFLQEYEVYSLDLALMVAGAKYRGDFEKRLKKTLKEIQQNGRIILFIDEIHTLLGAGSSNAGSLDAANMLKPVLTDGSLKCLGATTFEEYRSVFEKDKAFNRRFSIVNVEEPSKEACYLILKNIAPLYEEHHQVRYNESVFKACVDLTSYYMHDKFLPDKAIELLDEVGSRKKINPKKGKKISVDDVQETLALKLKIPKMRLNSDKKALLRNLEKSLKNKIFAQTEAINLVSNAIKIQHCGLSAKNKPVGSFLFVGPSGVGKTELAKELALNLNLHFERFDMSEYKEAHSVAKLIGSPSGYVGFEQGGLLVNAIKKHPHCLLLLDEIEKAHPNVYDLLLQVMDNATLSDNLGNKASFKHVILIMTSNVGSKDKDTLGFFSAKNAKYDKAVKELLTPELRSRIDAIVPFNALSLEDFERIVSVELDKLKALALEQGVILKFHKEVVKCIAQKSYQTTLGAREIKKIIHNEIKTQLSDILLLQSFKKPCKIACLLEKNQLVLKEIKCLQKVKENDF